MITGRTEEDDIKAKKAAAAALEMAFLKKKQLEKEETVRAEEKSMEEETVREKEESMEEEPLPIPAKRQSIKRPDMEEDGR